MVFHVLLCETSDGLALVDTGLGLRDVARPKETLGFPGRVFGRLLREDQTAIRQIEQLGYRAQDVRHIFPTHFDLDHVGGVSDFPHAAVHVLAREATDFADRLGMKQRVRYRPLQFEYPRVPTLYDGVATSFVDDVAAYPAVGLEEQIMLIPTPGHTHGHAAIAVRQGKNRWLIHCGDSFFSERALISSAVRPARAHGIAVGCARATEWLAALNPTQMRRTQEQIRTLRNLSNVRVFCAHDGAQFHALVNAE
ncbi:MBL fold metallo-hydrolase [Mycobacteroides abscessus subsp. bolletii]|uniref:MBL fold metallo-hydrolase n=1 Tax=Mycobacteroides abscessus TaxID=36809 RepID=UPI0019D1CBAE|nr:MBL fold metallo-hydrolase [Mycobacteroides abscessus]MBN7303151.1 MBL fold metallo-hydrolase [Mycobacteroides abscessus subsp. bolletii]